MKEQNLYDYLRQQCPTLEAAKAFMWKWCNEWRQCLPWEDEPFYSSRAMAGHVSNVLEGGNERTGYALGVIPYTLTKHGSELYEAAWSNPALAEDKSAKEG